MNINNPARAAAFFEQIAILPRRLLLETPGVEATVPMARGTWGAALHDLEPDAYRAVFDREGDGDRPPGYLLRPAPADPQFAPAIDWFLFGPALKYDAALRRAWHEAALRGLGSRRQPFCIRRAIALDRWERPLADGWQDAAKLAWRLSQAVWPALDAGAPCRLTFAAPLRLRRHGRLIDSPTLADLVVAACRRVANFLPDAERSAWTDYSAAALELAKQTPHTAWTGARLDLHRWSARQQSEVDLRGVAGWLDLPRGPGELAPLLAAARWLHIGKGTVLGLGQFTVDKL